MTANTYPTRPTATAYQTRPILRLNPQNERYQTTSSSHGSHHQYQSQSYHQQPATYQQHPAPPSATITSYHLPKFPISTPAAVHPAPYQPSPSHKRARDSRDFSYDDSSYSYNSSQSLFHHNPVAPVSRTQSDASSFSQYSQVSDPSQELFRMRKQTQLDDLAKRRKIEADTAKALRTNSGTSELCSSPPSTASSLSSDDCRVEKQSRSNIEKDERRLSQRQKQIDLGKNSPEYALYISTVALDQRDPLLSHSEHPITPRKHQVCSKRSWDGQVRKWRRLLHQWDRSGASADGTGSAQPPLSLHSFSDGSEDEIEASSELPSALDECPISSISMSTTGEGEHLAASVAEDILADCISSVTDDDEDDDDENDPQWQMQQQILNLARSQMQQQM